MSWQSITHHVTSPPLHMDTISQGKPALSLGSHGSSDKEAIAAVSDKEVAEAQDNLARPS